MFVIGYYKDTRVHSFAGVNRLGLPIETRLENELKKFTTQDEAKLWDSQYAHLCKGRVPVIMDEVRAKNIIRFFLRQGD